MKPLITIPRFNSAIQPLSTRPGGPFAPIPPVLVFELIKCLVNAFVQHAHEREQTNRYIAAAVLDAEKYRQDAKSLRKFMANTFQERREIIGLVAAGLKSDNIEIYERACQLIVEILRINPLSPYSELFRGSRSGAPLNPEARA